MDYKKTYLYVSQQEIYLLWQTQQTNKPDTQEYHQFLGEITARNRTSQYEAMKAVNKEMIALYWEVGKRISEQQKMLGWRKSVEENLSKDIQKEFPGIKGFGTSNVWDMARFYTEYQCDTILQPLVGEISWSKHIINMTKCKGTQQRQFYVLATKKFGSGAWTGSRKEYPDVPNGPRGRFFIYRKSVPDRSRRTRVFHWLITLFKKIKRDDLCRVENRWVQAGV